MATTTTPFRNRFLEEEGDGDNTETNSRNSNSMYAESKSSIYNGYQQAWRMLGFFVDCTSSDENEQDSHDGNNNNRNGNYQMNTCQRYLLWAAYVDEDYEGGGIGEYSFLDTSTGAYNGTHSCDVHGNGRCVPMDCHESTSTTTTWKLLGLYKEAYYASEWFEQLFKHEGYCLWDSNTYSFMKNYYASWPEGCTAAKISTASGQALYFDLKPTPGGYMAYALYTDSICRTEFVDNDDSEVATDYSSLLQQVLAKYGYLYGSNLEMWNMYMNVYKYCQPCRAYNLNYGANNNNNNNQHRRRDSSTNEMMINEKNDSDRIRQQEQQRFLEDGDYDPNDGYFQCYDDAGYTNVNQCMKFRTHTYMQSATIQDLQIAHQQGGILEITVQGHKYGMSLDTISDDGTVSYEDGTSSTTNYSPVVSTTQQSMAIQNIQDELPLFITSIVIFGLGIIVLIWAIRWKISRVNDRLLLKEIEEPLVPDGVDGKKKTKKNTRNSRSRGVLT